MVVSGRAHREASSREHPPARRGPSDEVKEIAREKGSRRGTQFVGDHGLHRVEDALQNQELRQTPHAAAICEAQAVSSCLPHFRVLRHVRIVTER